MPLSLEQATRIIKRNFSEGKIQAAVEYKGLFLFQIFGDDPDEGVMDPFYSVNKKTGEVRDFSVITDGNISEISLLFENAKRHKT